MFIKLFIMLLFFFLGFLLRQKRFLSNKHILSINHFIIYVALPALIINTLSAEALTSEHLLAIILPWVLIVFSMMFVFMLGHFFKWPYTITACLALCASFGNTSYLLYPVVLLLWGDAAMPFAVVFDQIGNFLPLAFVTALLLLFRKKDQNPALFFVKKVLFFPPFIAIMVALLTQEKWLIFPLDKILSLLAMLVIPLAMLVLGYQLEFKLAKPFRRPLLIGLSVKMLLMPLIAYLLIILLDSMTWSVRVSLLQSAAPPMVSAALIAIEEDLAPKLASAMVAFGLIFSIVTLPAFYLFFEHILN